MYVYITILFLMISPQEFSFHYNQSRMFINYLLVEMPNRTDYGYPI